MTWPLSDNTLQLKKYFHLCGSDESCGKTLLCTAWDIREDSQTSGTTLKQPGDEEAVTKASLHHTGSPVRMPKGKNAATCSHGNNNDYELSLDLKNKQVRCSGWWAKVARHEAPFTPDISRTCDKAHRNARFAAPLGNMQQTRISFVVPLFVSQARVPGEHLPHIL